MAEAQADLDYAVFLKEHRGVYELRIRELLLVVRGPDLQKAYEELLSRKQEIIDSARALGTLDEVPTAERPPLFETRRQGLFSRVWARLR
jgi:hypothetical protein